MVVYQTELCNWDNPKDAKFLSNLLYHCTLIDGKKGRNPFVNYRYFENHGTKEEFENAKKDLKEFKENQKNLANELEKELKNSPKEVKEIRRYFSCLEGLQYVQINRNAARF